MKKSSPSAKYIVITVAVSIVATLLALFAGTVLDKMILNSVATSLFILSWAIIFGITIVYYIMASIRKKKITNKVKEVNQLLTRTKDTIRNDLSKATKRLIGVARTTKCVLVIITFLALISVFFMCAAGGSSTFFILIAFYILFGMIYRFIVTVAAKPEPPKAEFCIDEESYPVIFSIARRAMANAGVKCEGNLYIVIGTIAFSAGISRSGKDYVIVLGSTLVATLDEEEFYNVMLHEFAHVTENYTPKQVNMSVLDFAQNGGDDFMSKYSAFFIRYPVAILLYEYMMYTLLASEFIETAADSAILKHGSPKAHVTALAKAEIYSNFDRLYYDFVHTSAYEAEEVQSDAAQRQLDGYIKAFNECGSKWLEIAERSIQPRSASHPIYRIRRENMGVPADEIDPKLPDGNTPYAQEASKVVLKASELVKLSAGHEYATARVENYLKPMKVIEDWKNSDVEYTADEYIPVLEAYISLGQHNQAIDLCDEMLSKFDNKFETVRARFMKACYLLDHDDEAGIDMMYDVIDCNPNYTQEGLNMVGDFCCRTGLEEQLNEYRNRAEEIMQKKIDENDHAGELSHKDKLTSTGLSAEIFEKNLEFMKSTGDGNIECIYLVRKLITKTYSSEVYVVKMKEGTADEISDAIMEKIFNYLDNSPEDVQYSLFLCNSYYEKIASKIKDSCIYKIE